MARPNRSSRQTGALQASLRSLDWPSLFVSLYAILSLLTFHPISPILLAGAALLLFPGLYLGRRLQSAAYRRTWNLASCSFVVLMLGIHLLVGTPSSVVLVYVSLFLLLHKWFNPRGIREHLEVWCLSTLVLLVGALEGRGLFSLFVFFGWGLSSVQLFNIIAVLRSWESPKTRATSPYQYASHSLRGIWGILPLMVLVTLSVFYVSPRVRPHDRTARAIRPLTSIERSAVQAGFSESVNLRSMSSIKQTDGIAFRVIDPPASVSPQQIRFRVSTLDGFDGWQWTRLEDGAPGVAQSLALASTNFHIPAQDGEAKPFSSTSNLMDWYYIRLVDYPNRLFPLPESTVALGGGLSIRNDVMLGHDGRVFVTGASPPREFQVLANPYQRGESGLPLLRGGVHPVHLHVPSPILEDVRGAASHMIPGTAITSLEKARHLSAYLRRNGKYTLDLDAYEDGPAALKEFLNHTLSGHCELYATAMAMILRSEGVPTRLVTGFSGAEYGAPYYGGASQDLVIGHKNAHAWVEVYDEEKGWNPFDPTPAVPLSTNPDFVSGSLKPFFQSNSKLIATLVEDYDYNTQRQLLVSLRYKAITWLRGWEHGALLRAWPRIKTNAAEPFIISLAFGLIVLNGLIAIAYFRLPVLRRVRKAASVGGAAGHRDAPRLFLDILVTLKAAEALDGPHASPRDIILRQAAAARVPYDQATRLAEQYTQWRYGASSRELEREIRKNLVLIRKSMSAHPS